MKKISVLVTVLFIICGCTSSAEKINNAVEQTLTAVSPAVVIQAPIPSPTQIAEVMPTVIPTASPIREPQTCSEVNGIELLSEPWHLEGDNGSSEAEQKIDPNMLQGKNRLLVRYDLHGLEINEGGSKDESAIIFNQPNWYVVSLANYGQNGLDGEQTIYVPLSDFISLPDAPSGLPGGEQLNQDKPVDMLHTRFWSSGHFAIDIFSICAFYSQP